MFIGASPGGTGGGIKTTTLRILVSVTRAVLQGKDSVITFQRQIPMALVMKAIAVFLGSLGVVVTSTTLLAIFDPAIPFAPLFFEVVSAFATVGLSTGITASLSVSGKLVLIGTMYVGRVGILLLMGALIGDSNRSVIRYPEEELLVG
jgi:trk system potassium uptake protein TrkH